MLLRQQCRGSGHGINLAFLAFVFRGDRTFAKRRAREVLEIYAACRATGDPDEWLDARVRRS